MSAAGVSSTSYEAAVECGCTQPTIALEAEMQHHERGTKMRERIIAAQILELERRQAIERATTAHGLRDVLDVARTDGAPPRGRR
jgi:hypothetical protein